MRLILALMIALTALPAMADRIKDIASVAGVRSNALLGYGLVVGLTGTGDGKSLLTQQAMQSTISRLGLVTNASGLDAKNTAAVMVTAQLPPFMKPGQMIDVTVSTIGKASSLRGGTLLMTPLRGADGKVYAIAQGNLVVGGLGVKGKSGSSVTINVPTVGRIPDGASVEKMVDTPLLKTDNMILNLHQEDFSTAAAVARAVNKTFGRGVAVPLDGVSIKVRAPADPGQRVDFMSMLENIDVTPAAPPAKVVINARTGTVVIDGNVRVTPAAVTHGSLTVRVNEKAKVTQSATVVSGRNGQVVVPGKTTVTPRSKINVKQDKSHAFIFDAGVSLSSLVNAINAVGASPDDLIAILEALRQAGALRAELVVI